MQNYQKTQHFKIIQSGAFLGRLLRPLMKFALSMMKNVHRTMVKTVLIPIGSTAVESAADARIKKS